MDFKEVKIDESSLKVFVCLDFIGKQGTCPFTGELSSIYDYSPERKWRHLDTMQYQTWFVARVPRVRNKEGKISLIRIPWADFSDRYTMLFLIR